MRPYQYKALEENEIRLISLHPASCGNLLSITIEHESYATATDSYEALSYVWGTSEANHSIYCRNGTNLLITANLRRALLRLRLPDAQRRLWIDAICINQQSASERRAQVLLMRHIYEAAKRAIIYLGEEADDSRYAAKFLNDLFFRYMFTMAEEEIKLRQNGNAQKFKDLNLIKIATEKECPSSQALFKEFSTEAKAFDPGVIQRALVHLLARPWFQRVWVIQEFVVAKDIRMLVGPNTIEWSSFLLAFAYAFPAVNLSWHNVCQPSILPEFYRGLSQMLMMHEQRLGFREGGRYRLLVLLARYRQARATKGADKLFALLGLSRDVLSFFPDYTLTDAAAFTMFGILCIERGEGDAQDLLSEACVTNERRDGIPSWIPDWRSLPKRRNFGGSMNASERFFHAGGILPDSSDKKFLKTDSTVLVAKGFILQTVIALGDAEKETSSSGLSMDHLLSTLQSMQAFKIIFCSYPTGESIDTVLAKILEAEQPRREDNVTSFREFSTVRDIQLGIDVINYSDGIAKNYPLTIAEITRLQQEEPHGLKNAARAIAGRVFAVTNKGYAGLLPSNTHLGDKICVIPGMLVPFVLREGIGCWTLVGDAYIDGFMQGEMVGPESSLQEIKIL